MVTLPELKEFVDGYENRQALLEVAFRFSKLGERARETDPSAAGTYTDTLLFIYDTIIDGFRSGPVRSVEIDLSEDLIPVTDEPECDEYLPEVSCIITMNDKDDDMIYYDFKLFPEPLSLNLRHYNGFVTEASEKAARTACMHTNVDDFVLAAFVKYAYLMGCGMPVREAVGARRAEIQMEYCTRQ